MPVSLRLVTPPRQEPVLLSEAKTHLRVSLEDDDLLILSYIAAARDYLERACNRQFLPAVWTLGLDGFACCDRSACQGGGIRLPRAPLVSLTPTATYTTLGITYVDTAGVTQTLAPAVYRVDTLSEPGRVFLAPSQTWPSLYEVANAVRITYLAGYATAREVPATLKQAILLLVGHMYEHREAAAEKALSEIPLAVQSLLWINRLVEVA